MWNERREVCEFRGPPALIDKQGDSERRRQTRIAIAEDDSNSEAYGMANDSVGLHEFAEPKATGRLAVSAVDRPERNTRRFNLGYL